MNDELPENVESTTALVPIPVQRIRRPEIVYTEAYLDDPIRFNTDQRLFNDPVTITKEPLKVYRRDVTGYLAVYMNKPDEEEYSETLTINTFSPVFSRAGYNKYIPRTFSELS